ncbi:hypothetical protein [Sphingomonas sp. 3P27F8]|uniref:hypothetical protein n=1 Tax=Sphingomonas sp. 3P27F8 TaxID=2502213 RepID=UPI001484DA2D|nr:hypothetical protein [Sphingomonas sp. 3P27F8]
MTAPVVLCGGARLPLADRIGRGGEGEIYAVADGSGRAVKVYLKPDAAREIKVRAIIVRNLGDACSNVTFPLEIVRYPDGRFAGFTMQQVAGHQPIHELITTASRRKHFPKADYRFLVHVALNVAQIVASAHAAGVVIGDINGSGFLVSQRGTVTLIDADSLQVGAHRCPVGMAEYTSPELQGVAFGTVDRTTDQDAFGLAVILFQILALGRHPFAGVVRGRPVQIDQAITKGQFAYSLLRTVGATPPPGALRLDDLPRAIRLLFERAFAGRGYPRPTAADWVEALGALAKSLTPCSNRSDHHVAVERGSCPWCPIERETGRPIFVGGINTSDVQRVASPSKMEDVVAEAIQHAKRYAGEAVMPMWSRPPAAPGKSARKALATIDGRVGQSPPSLRALQLGSGLVDKFIGRNDVAQRTASRALNEWRSRLGVWDIAKLIDQLREQSEQLDRLQMNRAVVVARATASGGSTPLVRLRVRNLAQFSMTIWNWAQQRRTVRNYL